MRFEFRPLATLARHAGSGFFIAAALSGALAQATPLPPDMATTAEQRFQLALEAETARDYAPMLALLHQAARDGEVQAQETLAWVLLAGPSLYGSAVTADRCEAVHWLRQAVANGSQTARSPLNFLNRLRNAPNGKPACASDWEG